MILPRLAMWIILNTNDERNGRVIYNTRPTPGAILKYFDVTPDENALWHFDLVVQDGKEYYKIRNHATGLYMHSTSVDKGDGETTNAKEADATLYEVVPLYKDDSYMIIPKGGNPLFCYEQERGFVLTRDDRTYQGGSSFKLAVATKKDFADIAQQKADEATYTDVWGDEFDKDGTPDPTKWDYEHGFVRNGEMEWYQPENAYVANGSLIIEGRKEHDLPNPWYDPNEKQDYRKMRKWINYTSSSVITDKKKDWLYGRFFVKGKIPVSGGSWPAIWFLGHAEQTGEWPLTGEIDLLEYYTDDTLGNLCWGEGYWETRRVHFKEYWLKQDPFWNEKWHVWRMDWDERAIKLYLDDELLNCVLLDRMTNPPGSPFENSFKTPQFLILNLALGATGGTIDDKDFPRRYYIDYVRVQQMKKYMKQE